MNQDVLAKYLQVDSTLQSIQKTKIEKMIDSFKAEIKIRSMKLSTKQFKQN